jgi:hypothetical protein
MLFSDVFLSAEDSRVSGRFGMWLYSEFEVSVRNLSSTIQRHYFRNRLEYFRKCTKSLDQDSLVSGQD